MFAVTIEMPKSKMFGNADAKSNIEESISLWAERPAIKVNKKNRTWTFHIHLEKGCECTLCTAYDKIANLFSWREKVVMSPE